MKRVSLEEGQEISRGGDAGRVTVESAVAAGKGMAGDKVSMAMAGDVAAAEGRRQIKTNSPARNGLTVVRDTAGDGRSVGVTERYGSVVKNIGHGTDSGDGAAGTAKRLPVVLADYLGDTSTIGMAVIDQPGTGMTTALLGFLEWYCRGEASGGWQVTEAQSWLLVLCRVSLECSSFRKWACAFFCAMVVAVRG